MPDKEYIDRVPLVSYLRNELRKIESIGLEHTFTYNNVGLFINQLNDQPTADVVEVRHGEWVKNQANLCWWLECSVCGEIPPKNRYNFYWQSEYCPNCGAKMDGKGEGE